MYQLLLSLMFRLPPERIHHLAFTAMKLVTRFAPIRWLVAKVLVLDDPVLRSQAFGLTFPAPLGLAAGFDKDATGVDAWGPLGFGFAEIGTVTAQAQPGNPQPRLFRLPADRALINRMGFNNHGAGHAANFLRQRRVTVPIGANIGKTKIVDAADAPADYTASAQLLGPLADFMVVNVSSPNTPGLRDLQAVESLRPLLQAVLDTVHIPVLVKIAPDLSDEDVDAVADLAIELGLAGIVATNTTIRRDGLKTPDAEVAAIGAGGLSGAPVADRSLEVLRRLYARVGDKLTIISVGGIETADQAWERILAGATLVQGYTGFIYGGPFWARSIHKGIAKRVRAAGFSSISQAVGAENPR
ncbi:quinone-dependent dihydroorotate dehydrogenase [Rhodococcus sp. ACPA4]|uniref:Dihydroorotate dehydrogenase (quinone) n=2 Tax=Nocardiaceae TaxID=85025 RepID=A0A652YN80_NOCGL|nr:MULTISPECIES: quinone-dependent dihydroorotate dehydrogenase [Rhodococcus]NMD62512.1 quinone-dependent dihydroorotate dehydrogenase [Nocardia globerula]NRI64779.1 quinone-dependent dihydroorotate dehydrogenase [Rhodococcus sp. MS16]KJF23030.1 Dihydroorotate dehydrogenase (quinone) [Rhodococcus sp. AD45]MCE4266994.1 quinone-dependent dihydroorotate dehydrogenase [Rhodococcus globerulus]MDV6269575.1 quinone-dependent dihydroorotate dehydrogenase [Rhodococcus globerulus]